jgi:integrase
MAITKGVVDAEKPGAKDRFVWDSGKGAVQGFGLKVTPLGRRVFVCQYRAGSGRAAPSRRVTIGVFGAPWTVETARKEAARILGQVAAGKDPAGEKRAKRQEATTNTVRAVAETWLKRDQAERRNLPEVKRILDRNVLPAIGHKPIRDLRKVDVIEMLDVIVDRGSPIAANRTLALVKRLLNWAAGRDLVDSSVAHYIAPPAPAVSRERVLSDAELVKVWRAVESIGGTYAAGVRLLMVTGARRDEIFGLHEAELDLDGAAIRLPASRSKVKEGRVIPLSQQAVAILEALPRFAGPYLFSATGERPRSDFARLKRRLDALLPDLEPWTVHDLRRSVATGLQRLDARLEAVEAVLGHISGSRRGVVGIYQRHSFEKEARAALDMWGRHLDALLTGQRDKVVRLRGRR